jgi:YbbR domain-containing protein
MISIIRLFVKSIPTLLLALTLAVAVWISAVSAADPVQQRLYPRPVTIEHFGQDPSLVISSEVPNQATVTLSAPSSIWDRMLTERTPIRATIDLSELGPGTHTVPVDIDPMVRPARVVNWTPRTVSITLERLITEEFSVDLVRRGEPAIGYQADAPSLSVSTVTISGPASRVEQVRTARVLIDLNQASDNINRSVEVQVMDGGENLIDGLSVTPEFVLVSQPISQRGGYRNVVVKVASTGQVAIGYRLTNISVFPPNVTVFSTNPSLVERLPGFVETSPLDLAGVRDDLEVRLPLNLPNGVEVVGEQTVLVQVGVAAIEGSVSLANLPITILGLPTEFLSRISPETVDVIISGPIPLLDRLSAEDVSVFIDLSGVGEGTYQFAPRVSVAIAELQVESILPSSIEVVVETRPLFTPTPTGTPVPTPTP